MISLSDPPPPPPQRALYTMEDIAIDIMDCRLTPKKKEDFDDDALLVTPSTSASSSPSLPSSTPPPAPPPPVAMSAIDARGGIRFGGMGRLASVPASSFGRDEVDGEDDEGDAPSSSSTSSSSSGGGWRIPASRKSMRTRNPIRAIVDPIMAAEMARSSDDGESTTAAPRKDQISLAVSGSCISISLSLSRVRSVSPSIHPSSLVAPYS